LLARFDKPEHISADRQAGVCTEFFEALQYKGVMIPVLFHAHHPFAPTGYKFERDASGACEQV
jgi:hypothetical protein